MNRQQLAEKIKSISGLNDEERTALLELLHERKKYGLVWEEKPEDAELMLKENLPVLREVKERAIISDSPDAPNHILIEGDNLHALTALSYTHAGKIDVIYIDPPYNTGKKDFKYNDDYVDKEDSYRHSKWLSFIAKRIKIAKQLLSESGIIFISIDNNEIGQLKLICDEIFSEDNSFGVLVWDLGTGTSAGHFTRAHEYVLAYGKNKSKIPNFSTDETGIIDDRALKKESKKNKKFVYEFKAGTKFEAPDGTEFSGTWGGTEKVELISGRFRCVQGQLADNVELAACWTQKNQMDCFFDGEKTFDSKGQRVIEFYFRTNGKLYCRKEKGKINPPSVLRDIATTKQGSSALKEIFGGDEEKFSFAKPIQLIKYLESLLNKDIIILDFFAGSGTTLHATLLLNEEDNGKRQSIIATNNENNICTEVTYPRIKAVIDGYTTPKGKEVEGLSDNNLRYYKIDFVGSEKTNENKRKLMSLATDLLCIKNNVYTELNKLGDKRLTALNLRLFTDGVHQMLVVYNENIIPRLVETLRNVEVTKPIMVYVFSHNSYAYNDDFYEVRDKVELCALPDAIYQAYKKVIRK